MRAVITVLGKDRRGIIHGITSVLVEHDINILDISQTIMQDFFSMVMIVDLAASTTEFEVVRKKIEEKGIELGMSAKIQHEDIFNSMHNI